MSGKTIDGRVYIDDSTISGAQVIAIEQDTDTVYEAETNWDGYYEIDVDIEGEYHVFCYYEDSGVTYRAKTEPYVSVELEQSYFDVNVTDTLFRDPAIPDSVTNHWPANEGEGGTVTDTEGNENLDYNGDWASDAGQGGAYLSLNGTSHRAVIEDTNAFDDDVFSWLIWFNPDDLSNQMIIDGNQPTNSGQSGYLLEIDGSGHLRLLLRDGDGGSNIDFSVDVLSAETWNFAAIIADNNNELELRHAVASDETTSQAGTNNYDNGTVTISDIAIGTIWDDGTESGDGRFFGGGIDDGYYAAGTAMSLQDVESVFDSTRRNYT